MSDEGSLSTVAAILAGTTDLAFVGLFRDQLPAGLFHQVLAVEPLVAVVGPQHPLRGTPAVGLRELADSSGSWKATPTPGCGPRSTPRAPRHRARRQIICEMRNPAALAALAL